jgi:phosphoribosylformylglycinamidine cyclo-ligase
VVERDRILTGAEARPGDVVLGLPSPGLRSNGYSLARRVLFDRAGLALDDELFAGHTVADELLRPSVIYAPAVIRLLGDVDVRALAHITGGGLVGNVPRVLPPGVDAQLDRSTWEVPRVFSEIQRLGGIGDDEMAHVFNLGVGMVAVVPPSDVSRALALLRDAGLAAAEIGRLMESDPGGPGRRSASDECSRDPRRAPAAPLRAGRRLRAQVGQAQRLVHRRQADDVPARRHAAGGRRPAGRPAEDVTASGA